MIHPSHGSRIGDGRSRKIKQHVDSTMTVYPDVQLHRHHCHDSEQLNDDDYLVMGAASLGGVWCVVCGVWCVVCGMWSR